MAIMVSLFSQPSKAQNFGDLLVTPTRVVFEGASRSQTLTLFNVGADSATYDISLVEYRMNLNGTFSVISVPDSGQLFSEQYIRFYPRTITLAPKEAQNVRIQYKPSAAMTDGEFRSHLYFRSVPRKKSVTDDANADTTALSIRMAAVYGVSIPVIARKGDLTAAVEMKQLAVTPGTDSAKTPVLSLLLDRTGAMSTYGDITVTWLPEQGAPMVVAVAKGVAVYTPNRNRTFSVPLRFDRSKGAPRGRLRVDYINRTDLKEKQLAQQEFPLQ
jgi:P pilus assembly chaperone PapD